MPKPIVNRKKCSNCSICVDICPLSIFEKSDSGLAVKENAECIGCRSCEVQCPESAINIKD